MTNIFTDLLIVLFNFSLLVLFNNINLIVSTDLTTTPKSIFTEQQKAEWIRKASCFQGRFRTQEQKTRDAAFCNDLIDNFCDHIQCEPIKSCPTGQTLVPNQVGRKCCPACITYLPDGAQCVPRQILKQCANGLHCDESKKICQIPAKHKEACLRDYHNRMFFRKMAKRDLPTGFWLPSEVGQLELMLEYAQDMELPSCVPGVGSYDVKQRSRNKAFCVNPDSGVPTFGVGDFGKADKVACKCSNAMYDKLTRMEHVNPRDHQAKAQQLAKHHKTLTEHSADTHMKCTQTGDYHEMQCINETCLCVDEFSGVPLTTVNDFEVYQDKLSDLNEGMQTEDTKNGKSNKDKNKHLTEEEEKKLEEEEKKKRVEELKRRAERIPSKEVNSSATAIFGAFRALPCFDTKRAKAVQSNFSKEVYLEDCQNQIHTSMNMQKHFSQKGTTVTGLEYKTCGYDDRFTRKQCQAGSCSCSDPAGYSIDQYQVPSSRSHEMDCRCAMEVYFVNNEKQSFDKLTCDGGGNFQAKQCDDTGSCHCVDSNGVPVSEKFNKECVESFIEKHAPEASVDFVCAAMRATVNSDNVWTEEQDPVYYKTSYHVRHAILKRPIATNIEKC